MFLPKFDQPCATRIAKDAVARGLLPMKPLVRVAICADGRDLCDRARLHHEADYWQRLFRDAHYCNRPDIDVQCWIFSFEAPPETLQRHLLDLTMTDIFYMTGFSFGRRGMSEDLTRVFRQHAVFGLDETDQRL